MSWLVAWFRDGELKNATVCHTERSMRRIANQFNEYAQLCNRRPLEIHGSHLHTVSVFHDSELAAIARLHDGLPKHLPKEVLEKRRKKQPAPRYAMFRIEL